MHWRPPALQPSLTLLGLKGVSAEQGVSAEVSVSQAHIHRIGHLPFESLDVYMAGMKAHGKELVGDIPKFTNATPVFQISEIVS